MEAFYPVIFLLAENKEFSLGARQGSKPEFLVSIAA